MSDLEPVPWDLVDRVTTTTGRRGEQVLDRHGDDLDPGATRYEQVRTLYAAWEEEFGDSPDQGGAYVLAYLLERDEGTAGQYAEGLPSLVDRRPPDGRLDRWFREETQVPWWIAVRCGVHYALVQYWLREAGIPPFRRNVPPELLAEIDAIADERE